MLFVWERLRDVLPSFRAQYKNPHEQKNLETAANAYIEWWTRRTPGAYEAYSARVRG